MNGNQETFSFHVTGSQTLDCLVDWRQNCGDCIVAASTATNNLGCDWCPTSNQCKSSGTCGAGTPLTTASACPVPGFSQFVLKDASGNETGIGSLGLREFSINQAMKISWSSEAISSSSNIEVSLIYYDCVNWQSDGTYTLCDSYQHQSFGDYSAYYAAPYYPVKGATSDQQMQHWAYWDMANEMMYAENLGNIDMEINNAYESQWAIKVKFADPNNPANVYYNISEVRASE